MKKLLLAIICLIIGGMAFAQAPQKISYQAVIRNNNGNLVTNQQVSLRISIMKNGGTTGQIDQPIVNRSIVAIYTETHTVTTNANGLATIEIGGGTTSDNFAAIDWSNGTYYLKTSVDLTGRGRYEVMGMSQLISVPYAMYAQKAGSAVTETDPQFNAWDKDYNDLTNRPEIPVVPTNVSAFENDANYITSADVPAQVNADWNATSGAGQILNKPAIPTVPTNVSAFTNDANYITSADVPAQVNADWNATSGAGQILNKPEIPTVPTNVSAFTNDANYITSADVPAQVNADWNATSGAGQILNKPEIPTVPTNVSAFTNDANYITSADVPAQVNADWNATSGAGQILNKPELFSGNYNDLTNKPEIPTVPTNVSAFTNDANYITSADVPAQVNADWNATSGAGQILNKPELFSGNYNDLANKPEIPTVPTNVSAFTNDANYITSADVPAQINADWNATSGAGQILNKPAIPTVPTNVSAFTNDANYITSADVPAQVNADWNATSGAGQILNKPELFSGNYNDLTNKPAIPTVPTNVSAFTNDANYITSADVPAQVNADWNATSGAGQILNKPAIPTVPTNVSAFTNDANYITSADVPAQVNADWNATSGAGQILNKPEIPTVPTNVSAFTNDANYITSADVPAQVNADWNATSGAGQILNKPEIPTVPTNVSAFTNDANYITSADVPAQVNADWNATSGAGQILNKPAIPTVPTNVSAFTNDANYITSADVPAQVNADWNATSGAGQILNKPELFSGNYNDLTNKPTIPVVPTNVSAFENDANYITSADVPAQVNADWNATSGAGQILNKPEIPTVPTNVSAFTNDANYITSADVPAQVNADWNATSGAGQILNKPEIPTVPTTVSAFTNDANYITSADVPAQVNADWNATSGAGQILNKPAIPTVPTNVSAFANDANYITSADVPAQVNADWNATSGAGQILNKPELFSGNYNDLTNKPAIPTVPTNVSAFTNDANYITSADVPAQVNADWNATSGAGQILNKPELFSGNYNDLTNKPAIPTVPTNVSAFANDANYITSADVPAQVNADWNATSGAGQILNKPELFDGNYNNLTNTPDLSGYITAESQTLADAAALGNAINAQIKNLTDPTENQDAATKKYVDELIAQLQAAIDALSSSGSGSGTTPSGNLPATYTITFDANGGTGTMEPQTFTPGAMFNVPFSGFSNANNAFKKWNTSPDGTGATFYAGQQTVLWSDITLYAQWGDYDTVVASNGSVYKVITVGDQMWTETISTSSNNRTCPDGFHVPRIFEWVKLIKILENNDNSINEANGFESGQYWSDDTFTRDDNTGKFYYYICKLHDYTFGRIQYPGNADLRCVKGINGNY